MTNINGQAYLVRNNYNAQQLATMPRAQQEEYINYLNGEVAHDEVIFVTSDKNGNVCTDGKDDGKIGLGSKIWNTVKGAGKGLLNMVGGALKHPIKTALGVAACFIPVVGPVIGAGFAAYGLFNGVKTIANGVKAANAADTDAEAKAAWQNIGNGTFTTVASAIALKGSASVLKNQLTGGSATVNGLRDGSLKGSNTAQTMKNVAQSAGKETLGNMQAAGNAVRQKIKNAKDAIKNDGGLGNHMKKVASNKLEALSEKIKCAETPAARMENARALVNEAKMNGAEVTAYRNGLPKEIKFPDGRVMKFAKNGSITSDITTTTTASKSGKTTETVTTDSVTGSQVIEGKTPHGKTTTWYKETTGANGINSNQSLNVQGDLIKSAKYGKVNTNSGLGYETVIKGGKATTTYTIDGVKYNANQLNPFSQAAVKFDTTTNILNTQMPISDKTALYMSGLIEE